MIRLVILTSILFFGCNQEKVNRKIIKREGMVLIPSGSFFMGSEDKFSRKDESPKHLVYVDSFWIDQNEVTNGEFTQFVEATGYITTAEIPPKWEEIKKEGNESIFDDINTKLPPVNTAFKVQRKAKTLNLSYKNYDEALDDLISEINELKEATTLEDRKSELGDVYFSLINVSRYLEADPEIELKKSIQTFINRAKYVEKHINKETDINALWQEAKKNQIDS